MVTPDAPDDDTFAVQDLRHSGWEPQESGHLMWQARINRRIVVEGTWAECTTTLYDAVAHAHDQASLTGWHGGTTTAGAAALLTFGAQAQQDQPASAHAYGLSLSVRPQQARTLWVRDRVEGARAALRHAAGRPGPDVDVGLPSP